MTPFEDYVEIKNSAPKEIFGHHRFYNIAAKQNKTIGY